MEWAQQFVDQYGYWAVFIWTFIEGETVFLVAAALASTGLMNPYILIPTAALGAFSGHLAFFALGRWRGMAFIHAIPWLEKHETKAKQLMDQYLDKYGIWTIFLFQYLYGTRIVAAILFGCSSIKFWRFCMLQVVNCISWACVIYTVGYMLGASAQALIERVGLEGLLVVVIIGLAAGLCAYLGYRKR